MINQKFIKWQPVLLDIDSLPDERCIAAYFVTAYHFATDVTSSDADVTYSYADVTFSFRNVPSS